MTAAAPHPPTAARPLAVRRRADLVLAPRGDDDSWVVKDPIGLRYYCLSAAEHFVLVQLDGRVTLDEIRRRLLQRYPDDAWEPADLQRLLERLYAEGLLVRDGVPAPSQHNAVRRRPARSWLGLLLGLLAIRLAAFDPERLLQRVYPKLRWLFSPWLVGAALLSASGMVLLVGLHWRSIVPRLPELRQILAAENLIALMLAIGLTKIVHEFGHALACKHFGGECHEMGLLLLAFIPSMYCNVSDSWMLSGRWRRAAVAAGGVYFETLLACLCGLLWWRSQPGALNAICLNVVLTAVAGTLIYNANPLMRADGYFMLSDLTGTPNLGRQARDVLMAHLGRWFLGTARPPLPASPRKQAFLLLYAIASLAYRLLVLSGIFWLICLGLRAHGLESLVKGLALAVAVAIAHDGLAAVWRTWTAAGGWRSPRAIALRLLAPAALVAALFLPLPNRVSAPARTEFAAAERVYLQVPGRLRTALRPGDPVVQGDLLAELENPELAMEVERLGCEQRELRRQLAALEKCRGQAAVEARIPIVREMLAGVDQQIQTLERQHARLRLQAPCSGTVLPPPSTPSTTTPTTLGGWDGSPLDERNRGAHLATGTLFCLIGDAQRLEARLTIDGSDLQDVEVGQRVAMQFDARPGEILWGTIVELAEAGAPSRSPPEPHSAAGSPELQPGRSLYQARAALDDLPTTWIAGLSGWAKIHAPPQSLFQRARRFLARTFDLW